MPQEKKAGFKPALLNLEPDIQRQGPFNNFLDIFAFHLRIGRRGAVIRKLLVQVGAAGREVVRRPKPRAPPGGWIGGFA